MAILTQLRRRIALPMLPGRLWGILILERFRRSGHRFVVRKCSNTLNESGVSKRLSVATQPETARGASPPALWQRRIASRLRISRPILICGGSHLLRKKERSAGRARLPDDLPQGDKPLKYLREVRRLARVKRAAKTFVLRAASGLALFAQGGLLPACGDYPADAATGSEQGGKLGKDAKRAISAGSCSIAMRSLG